MIGRERDAVVAVAVVARASLGCERRCLSSARRRPGAVAKVLL